MRLDEARSAGDVPMKKPDAPFDSNPRVSAVKCPGRQAVSMIVGTSPQAEYSPLILASPIGRCATGRLVFAKSPGDSSDSPAKLGREGKAGGEE